MNALPPVRVGLDLDGSLESLDNTMTDLADALSNTGECQLVRFRTQSAVKSRDERRIPFRPLWAPLWRRSLGPAIDLRLPPLDVVHVAGLATPPTTKVPLIISVDDLRPLRGESREHQRINQLRRAVARGAVLVASSRSASHEVQREVGLQRSQVVVVPPAVPLVDATLDGADLVVNITGLDERFLALAPRLLEFVNHHGARVVAVTSSAVGQRIRASGLPVKVLARRDARLALGQARVVLHMSDGARFPSFAIAALGAGVPTIALATSINRELLGGAAALALEDEEVLSTLPDVWSSAARRSIMVAAGRARAVDFAPSTAARAYLTLYRDVVRG
ncbi:MAG: glycosyltransferase [Acidobacteria bacterium]|nr:glycosyltransferase [Acidobacteriota bacterium]